jgi:hypothetical protein
MIGFLLLEQPVMSKKLTIKITNRRDGMRSILLRIIVSENSFSWRKLIYPCSSLSTIRIVAQRQFEL